MFVSLLITLREGLEAALIVGIVLSVLRRAGYSDRARFVWGGILVAAAASALIGVALHGVGARLEGPAEAIFEGLAMLLAAGVLTWMIYWMQRQGGRIQAKISHSVQQAAAGDDGKMLFWLAFVAVFREGLETALFLVAAAFSTSPLQTIMGGILGLASAVALGWLIYAGGRRLNLRAFFSVTSLLLILVAAGLVAHGVHELEEVGWLPPIVAHVWNINPILNENGVGGSLLKALFGYNGNPSLLEVTSYIVYLVIVTLGNRLVRWRMASHAGAGSALDSPSTSR